MNYIKGIFTEDNGNFSSKRLIALFWFLPMTLLWIIESITKKQIEDIPNGVYMISGVVAGMLAVGKFGEQKVDGQK